MAAEKLLSEAACKAAKAKESIYYLNDGAGLRLRVRPDGSRTWVYRYRLNGKEMSAGLGAYSTVTLQIARVKAQQSKLLAKEGSTPICLTHADVGQYMKTLLFHDFMV